MTPNICNNWQDAFSRLKGKPYFQGITQFVKAERASGKTVYPPVSQVFRAFEETPFNKVKVVILGQDPYHGVNQANGLCFSVNEGIKVPPSLRNIYKEIRDDLGVEMPDHGDLTYWAQQGVLLINSVLTVESGQAGSHSNLGWEKSTDFLIESLNDKTNHVIYLLWGAYAQRKATLIKAEHTIITAPHPSPLSAYRGFFGCKNFSKCNQILEEKGQEPIQWAIK